MSEFGVEGFGPGSSVRFSQRSGPNNQTAVRYPSPWWDVATMDLPRSVKHLFKWCRYHALCNPLIAAVVRKMASYPITEIVIEDEPLEGFDNHHERWKTCLFQVLKIDQEQVRIGLDYHCFGNCLVTLLVPFEKWLCCPTCKYRERIKRLKMGSDWLFKDFTFLLSCPKCKTPAMPCNVEDVAVRKFRELKLKIWNPSDIDIDYNPMTCTTQYAYTVPEKVRTRILRKDRRYLEETQHVVIQALKERRQILINPENIYHFKVPTPSLDSNDEGWGYPAILPALKDSFYLQLMKKAQEAVLHEHILPLDILFPATGDSNANPYQMVSLGDWKGKIEKEILRWRQDPNYKPILPIPLGHERIGGNGRALMLTQEIRAWSEHIIAGMSVPQEFVFGGLTWSGSSVSLRMLENQFYNYRLLHENFLQHWLIPSIARVMGWSEIKLHLREFKMADDMQMKQLMIQMNATQKISDKTLLAEFARDSSEERKIMENERRATLEVQRQQALQQAEIQNEVMAITARGQAKLQSAGLGMPMDPNAQGASPAGGPGMPMADDPNAGMQAQAQPQQQTPQSVNVLDWAEALARKIGALDPVAQDASLQNIRRTNPELARLVKQKIGEQGPPGGSGGAGGINMSPLPTQRPPRRENASI